MRRFAHRVASRLTKMLRSPEQSAAAPLVTTISEITPCLARAAPYEGIRLNLFLPSINDEHYFGGIHTAVTLYQELLKFFPRSRVIILDSPVSADAMRRFSDHVLVEAEIQSESSRQVLCFSDRYGKTMPVSPGDIWLSSAWWTAYAAQRLSDWQGAQYGANGKVSYLVQDFEPGFYSWSSQSALALATYRPTLDIAIFNTRLLADYFESEQLSFARRIIFEPTLNAGLRGKLVDATSTPVPRRKRIVVYARPSTPRNAFELICEALREWGWTDPLSQEWEVVAVGELAHAVDLGPLTVCALGKLSIDDYAELLSTSAIGLSLMVSPHPSYPPLEMAAFGMGVVTNVFSNKDLTAFSPNIRSVSTMSPQSLASALTAECAAWHGRGMMPTSLLPASHPFLSLGTLTHAAEQLASMLKNPQ